MSSCGRGRGWRINQNQNHKDQILRRPGETGSGDSIVQDITNKIAAYDIHECISLQLIQEIVDLLTSTINKGNLKDICNTLWKQAILEDSLTTRTAVIFSDNRVALIEDNDKDIIRTNFLRFLQDNYLSKEKSKVEDSKTFANIVLLHAEIYYCMRLSDGKQRLKILAEPLIHYLEDILQDNPNDNIYFVMIQILRSGKDLYAACPEQLSSLIMTIRQILLKENYTSQNRTVLLLMIELANNAYEIKDPQLKHFYVSNIKSFSFEYPFSQVELKVIAKTKTEYDDPLSEINNNQQVTKEETDISAQDSHLKSHSVPRAIRGSGALDKPKKGDGVDARLKALKITPPRQKSNKGWDHDDRFHIDYK